MKQARFYIMLVFISFCAPAQNRPGIDYFAQLGFFDFIVNLQKSTKRFIFSYGNQGGDSKRTIIILTNFRIRADQFCF
jgi:hypothetical protein